MVYLLTDKYPKKRPFLPLFGAQMACFDLKMPFFERFQPSVVLESQFRGVPDFTRVAAGEAAVLSAVALLTGTLLTVAAGSVSGLATSGAAVAG